MPARSREDVIQLMRRPVRVVADASSLLEFRLIFKYYVSTKPCILMVWSNVSTFVGVLVILSDVSKNIRTYIHIIEIKIINYKN